MTDQYVLIGNPVEHSLSPFIHHEFARTCGIDLQYRKVLSPLDGFEKTLLALVKHGTKGANVTVPFKTQAYFLADSLSDRARVSGAANTLSFIQQKIHADNTDGAGLIYDLLHNLACSVAGKRVLLLGAGGAARGVLLPLLDQLPAQLVIANRSLENALSLSAIAKKNKQLFASDYALLVGQEFDLIINATSSSLTGDIPPILPENVACGALVYDMMYSKEDTAFLRWAKDTQAEKISDGLGMLVEQAAESFFIWYGIRPNGAQVLQLLRSKLA